MNKWITQRAIETSQSHPIDRDVAQPTWMNPMLVVFSPLLRSPFGLRVDDDDGDADKRPVKKKDECGDREIYAPVYDSISRLSTMLAVRRRAGRCRPPSLPPPFFLVFRARANLLCVSVVNLRQYSQSRLK